MAVSTTVNPIITPLNQGQDKRLPIAIWQGQGSIGGDASGGAGTVIIQWSNSVPGVLFSVEYVSMQSGGAADIVGAIQIRTQVTGPEATALDYFDNILMRKQGGTTETNGAINPKTPPFFPDIRTAWFVQCQTVNPGAGATLNAHAWGYVWETAALNLPGGPARPGDFLPPP